MLSCCMIKCNFDLETNSRSPETKHGIETALLMTFTGAHPGDGDDNNSRTIILCLHVFM